MPPLAALKLIFSLAVTQWIPDLTGKLRRQMQKCIALIDVRNAFFWADAVRKLYVELPEESGVDVSQYVAELLKSLYGTQDAGRNWQLEIKRVMVDVLGFKQGMSNPCLYWHEDRDMQAEVHGDDFTVLAAMEDLHLFIRELKKHWALKDAVLLGPPGTPGTVQEARLLNRIVTWDQKGILWEPDPRHVDIILERTGVKGKVTSPLVKEKVDDANEDGNEEPLSRNEAEEYRSLGMRAAYVAQDRADLQRATREIAKGLQTPTTRHQQILKRLARYLLAYPRTAQRFSNQRSFGKLSGW